MSNGVCVQKSPYKVDLEAGDHYWCSCGLSKNQPYCDGSHKGSAFTPMKFTQVFCFCFVVNTVFAQKCKSKFYQPVI